MSQTLAAVAAGADNEADIGEVETTGRVSGVSYTPAADITGANVETRTFSLVNKGTSGDGTTIVATLAMANAVNASNDDEKALTLSATPANLVVAPGQILAFQSTHAGATGLADPGGLVQVEVQGTA